MSGRLLQAALDDYRNAVERLRLTVEGAPTDAPRPVQALSDIVTDFVGLADHLAHQPDDPDRTRRESHRLLLRAQAWPLVTDLADLARREGGWPAWLETVWLDLRDLGAATERIDTELADDTYRQGRT